MALLFSALDWAIIAFVLWIISKILKFKRNGLVPAAFLSLFYIVIGYVFPVAVTGPPENVAFMAFVWVLSMKLSYNEGWLKTFAASVIVWIGSATLIVVAGLLLWQIAVSGI